MPYLEQQGRRVQFPLTLMGVSKCYMRGAGERESKKGKGLLPVTSLIELQEQLLFVKSLPFK